MKKVSQNAIAQRLGISKSYLSMILSGQRKASPELANKIRSLLPVNSTRRILLHTQEVTGSSPVLPTIVSICLPAKIDGFLGFLTLSGWLGVFTSSLGGVCITPRCYEIV